MEDFELFSKPEEDLALSTEKDDFKLFSGNKENFVFETVKEEIVKERPGCFLIGISFLITLITPSFTFLQGYLSTRNIAYSVGQAIGPVFLAITVVLFFQIGKSFRNNKSRLKIYFWTMILDLLVSFFQFITMISGLR